MSAPVTRGSTLLEMGELVRTRPGLHTSVAEVAAWYEQKSVVLHHIAVEAGDAAAERCSRVAHAHAAALLAGRARVGGGWR